MMTTITELAPQVGRAAITELPVDLGFETPSERQFKQLMKIVQTAHAPTRKFADETDDADREFWHAFAVVGYLWRRAAPDTSRYFDSHVDDVNVVLKIRWDGEAGRWARSDGRDHSAQRYPLSLGQSKYRPAPRSRAQPARWLQMQQRMARGAWGRSAQAAVAAAPRDRAPSATQPCSGLPREQVHATVRIDRGRRRCVQPIFAALMTFGGRDVAGLYCRRAAGPGVRCHGRP